MAHILVIDDDGTFRGTLRLALEAAGHRVLEAGDGCKGVQAARAQALDLILCDIFMPAKEGLETIRELRREFPALPIIAMSGGLPNLQTDFLPMARALGATETLVKPFSIGELHSLIARFLPPG